MKKQTLNELTADNEFNSNSIIHSNGIIYSNYVGSPMQSFPSEPISIKNILTQKIENIDLKDIYKRTISQVVGKEPIADQGFFVYDKSDLLKLISKYGKELFDIMDLFEVKNYIYNSTNIENSVVDKLYIDIKSNKLNVVIDFFKEFGFPFNNINEINPSIIIPTFQYSLIESQVIPSLLLIYMVNSIYDIIKFLENDKKLEYEENIIDDLDKYVKILYENFDTISFDESIIEIKNEILELRTKNNNDENKYIKKYNDRLQNQLFDYKYILLNIINLFSQKFTSPAYFTYINNSSENSQILMSDNLLDLLWKICTDKISNNFKFLRDKNCIVCGKPLKPKKSKYCSEICRKEYTRKNTQNNKKKLILDILKYENHIFLDDSINKKIVEFQILQDNGGINNIEEHKYLIRDLKSLREKIDNEINNNRYTLKKVEN